MQRASDRIWRCVDPVVTGLGFIFVGADYGQAEGGMTLRVFIDKEGGIVVDDCAIVSNQLSAVLDVEEPITGHYVLEVSSPGLNRPLFQEKDFELYAGSVIKLKTFAPVDNRRNFKGLLQGIEGDLIQVVQDGEVFAISIDNVEQAKVVPKF